MAVEQSTKDLDTMLGNPRRAILSMAIPLILAMAAQNVNNLIDAIWVTDLGADALAAVGLVFPIFFIMIAVGNGIGIGATAVISRYIGAGKRDYANRSATQAFILSLVTSALTTIVLLILFVPIMRFMGAEGNVLECCKSYGYPIVICTVIAVHVGVMSSLFRAEGAAKRSMTCQIIGAGLNIVLDPLFMFVFGWGLAGAAWATVVSMLAGMSVFFYWLFIKKDTYLELNFRGFKFDRKIIGPILHVGIPASIGMMIASIAMILMDNIIIVAGGSDGVASYTASWRIIQMEMLPMMGISDAIVPVCAAAFGMRRGDKIASAFWYSFTLAIGITLVLSLIVALTANYVAVLFSYSEDTIRLREDISQLLRIAAIFLPFSASGFIATSLFQSLGMGGRALVTSLVINVLQIPCCFILVNAGGGMNAVYWGICITEIAGALVSVAWAILTMRKVGHFIGAGVPRET